MRSLQVGPHFADFVEELEDVLDYLFLLFLSGTKAIKMMPPRSDSQNNIRVVSRVNEVVAPTAPPTTPFTPWPAEEAAFPTLLATPLRCSPTAEAGIANPVASESEGFVGTMPSEVAASSARCRARSKRLLQEVPPFQGILGSASRYQANLKARPVSAEQHRLLYQRAGPARRPDRRKDIIKNGADSLATQPSARRGDPDDSADCADCRARRAISARLPAPSPAVRPIVRRAYPTQHRQPNLAARFWAAGEYVVPDLLKCIRAAGDHARARFGPTVLAASCAVGITFSLTAIRRFWRDVAAYLLD